MGRLGGHRRILGLGQRLGERFDRLALGVEGRVVDAGALQRRALALDRRAFAFEPGQAARLFGEPGGQRVAPRVEIGRGGLRLGERRLGAGEPLLEAGAPLLGFVLDVLGAGGLGLQRPVLCLQARQHLGGVDDQRLLALLVLRELGDAALEFGDPLLDALLLAGERVAGQHQPMQRRADARLLLAQRRQGRGGDRLQARGLALRAGALGDVAHVLVEPLLRPGELRLLFAPGDEARQRLLAADVLREIAIARRLAGLALEAVDLGVDLLEHVLEPQQIVLGALEPELGLVAARMQPGNAGRFFENQAARLRLGGDDLADLALAHHRRRARAGGGVGEQQLHIAGAHFAAVDAIGGARFAFDAARDLDRFGVVEGGGRASVRVVEDEADLGEVARGALAGAREDHVVHA